MMNTNNDILNKLTGVIPSLITPLDKNGNLDKIAFRRLIKNTIKAGCNGIMILAGLSHFFQ